MPLGKPEAQCNIFSDFQNFTVEKQIDVSVAYLNTQLQCSICSFVKNIHPLAFPIQTVISILF